MLAVYVSGHGFGHATRTACVLAAVRALRPELPITVVTAAPAFLFDGLGATVRPLAADVGLAQQGALVIDEDATVAACAAFAARWPALVAEEVRGCARRASARAGRHPAARVRGGGRAGVPGVGCANFSWDWIYAGVAGGRRAARRGGTGVGRVRARRAPAGAAVRGRPVGFPGPPADPDGRAASAVARRDVRARLGLDGARPVVLLSFGGLGLPGFDRAVLAPLETRFRFLDASGLPADRLRALGLAYPDVVGASDVVVTKPGYGIVTDAIAAGARLVYTDRGAFPEYDVMVREMAGYLPTGYVRGDDLRAGRLGAGARRRAGASGLRRRRRTVRKSPRRRWWSVSATSRGAPPRDQSPFPGKLTRSRTSKNPTKQGRFEI